MSDTTPWTLILGRAPHGFGRSPRRCSRSRAPTRWGPMDDMSPIRPYTGCMTADAVPDQRWLDESEQAAWRSFVTMHARLFARINRSLAASSGLSDGDYAVLVSL